MITLQFWTKISLLWVKAVLFILTLPLTQWMLLIVALSMLLLQWKLKHKDKKMEQQSHLCTSKRSCLKIPKWRLMLLQGSQNLPSTKRQTPDEYQWNLLLADQRKREEVAVAAITSLEQLLEKRNVVPITTRGVKANPKIDRTKPDRSVKPRTKRNQNRKQENRTETELFSSSLGLTNPKSN